MLGYTDIIRHNFLTSFKNVYFCFVDHFFYFKSKKCNVIEFVSHFLHFRSKLTQPSSSSTVNSNVVIFLNRKKKLRFQLEFLKDYSNKIGF